MFQQSPIPYSGSKWRILTDVWKSAGYLEYDHLLDVFCGSLTVSLNLADKAKKIIANDIQKPLIMLYEGIANDSFNENAFFAEKNELIKQYAPKDFFNLLKEEYNSNPQEHLLDILFLAYYCHGGMVSFNGMKFQTGYGKNKGFTKKGITENYRNKFEKFCKIVKDGRFTFTNLDFREIDYSQFGEKDLIYFDPPYFVTNSFYNSSWHRNEEIALYEILDDLSSRKVNWILSNATKKGNNVNYVLQNWLEKTKYHAIYPRIQYNMNSAKDDIDEIMVFSNPLLFPQ